MADVCVMLIKLKYLCVFLCFLVILNGVTSVYAQESSPEQEQTVSGPDQLYAISAVLMDGDTGRVLYEKNGY